MSPSPEIGHLLDGRYRLDNLIGAGGMARVYQATHTNLSRRIAVKVLRPELGRDRDAIERFRREAFASGQLDHPNIVAVSDCGLLADGAMFLAMELLEGESLENRLSREQRFAWPVALGIMRGLLAGLQYAHDRDIVHCDIKPENVFLAVKHGDATVKLLDFGIARLYSNFNDAPSELTIGTPAYMSPEQARGATLTPASDLYSASVVLYEMLTGMAPFAERTPRDTLLAHVTKPVPRFPPELGIPAALEQLVLTGLSKAPAKRFATAKAFQREIDGVLQAAGHAVPTRALTSQSSAPSDFEVLQQLGSTELTDAFIARRGGEPPVVIKRLRPFALDPRIVDRFLSAARVASRITDERVARVVASGGSGESTFVAVDYLPGEALDTVVGAELSIQLAVWILHEATTAIHAAHELCDTGGQPIGFVHGRITPASVVVRHSGDIVVVDFEASAGQLLPKHALAHVSPEELAGQPIDRRSDVFALGVVLWEVLARRSLFPPSIDRKRTPIKRLSSVMQVSAELDQIVATSLAADPELRFQTAEAFRVALAGFLHRTGFAGRRDVVAEYLESVYPERLEAGRRWLDAARLGAELPLIAPLPSKIRRAPETTVMSRKRPLVAIGAVIALALGGSVFALSRLTDDRTAVAAVAQIDAPVATLVVPRPEPVIDPRLAQVELAIREGRLVAPKQHNALELLGELPGSPAKLELNARAVETLHASARMLWDRGKPDSARVLYADLLKFDPADRIALERTKVAKPVVAKTANVDTVRRLVVEIDLAIIERRFVAPAGHNALEYLTRLRQIDPANAASRLLGTEVASALAKEAQASPADARKLLEAAKQARGESEEPKNPSRTAELVATARQAASAGNFTAAAKSYEAAVAADPMSHAALAGLAEIAYNQGDFGRAVLSAKRAVAVAPRAVAYRMTLAKAYFKLLRYDDAIAQWKGVLAIDPGNAAAAKHIELANSKR